MTATVAMRGADIIFYANTGTDATPVWTPIGGQQGATLTEERETVETSNKNSDNTSREFEYGFYQWSISCDGIYVPSDAAWASLKNCIRNAIKVKVRVKEQGSYTLEGLALVTSQEVEGPWDDSATYAVELQGTGILTPNPA